MSSRFEVGHLVDCPGTPGIGRVGEIQGDSLRIDFFESVAEPAVESLLTARSRCRRVRLPAETRVYWRNPSTGVWRAGRVKGDRLPEYFVQFPNSDYDFPVHEHDLRVRWDRPVRDPVQVLASGGNESGYFHDARLPMLRSLVSQRAASANVPALLSAAVEIYPHQVRAALTVLADPVQRYLLADEVGLGKTVEAGYVIRQTMIDNPSARITVIAPDTLRRQWVRELTEKFFIDDFPQARVKFSSHGTPEKWRQYHDSDLVVVDEAHALVETSGPGESPYRELCELAHASSKLLLLSATPVTSHYITHLGLLHLLDPDLYRWDDREAFERRYALRAELADSVYGLNPAFTYLLPSTIEGIRGLLPQDARFEVLAAGVLELLDEDDDLRDEADRQQLVVRVDELRAHISETYRLHRRVIRQRRAQVLRDDATSVMEPYEVRGREEPDPLESEIFGQQATQDCLLEWRTGIWDHLLDEGAEEQQAPYALALGVLASRASGPADDFVDALRWRVRRDGAAGDRAGLTVWERQLLSGPCLVEEESRILDELEGRLAEADGDTDIKALVHTLLPVLRQGGRIVVFCGPGGLAENLAERLRTQFPKASIGSHTCSAGVEESEQAVVEWSAPAAKRPTRVLIADQSAEDGLNLQMADAVVHLRLPWSPNRLEQRLGRVDRYRGVRSAGQAAPARQYVLRGSAGAESFHDAWLSVLVHGYEIFSGSASTLQDAIAQGLADVWGVALRDGPDGFPSAGERVREEMGEARRQIDKMDMLEAIHETSTEERDIASALGEIEWQWHSMRDALLRYAGDSEGGIKFRHYERTVDGCPREVFDLGSSHPLIAPRLYARERSLLSRTMAQATFNRSAALRVPGTRLFRIGNPFIDMLGAVIAVDDRGQAAAFRRIDDDYRGDPLPYFGFDFLVEADTSAALRLVADRLEAQTALRRQADRILPPFMLKVWIPAGSDEALVSGRVRAWLDEKYDNRRDENFNAQRIRDLTDIFGGWSGYQSSAAAAEQAARRELARATDLTARCSQAQEQARRVLAVAKAQAEAREAAGHLVGDAESYLRDVTVTNALVEGLTRPIVRVVSVTCVVRSRRERKTSDA
ncbi:protein DpdE [Kitasatospora aureofaciens]|uniref:protein DpdE n=1 Tax=Kitasatospora aureofaciens TaxID=1894 RepID=UPI0036F49F3D